MLRTAVSIDIIVPLSPGICSRVKLLADEATIPKNQLPTNIETMESETLGTRTNEMVSIPDNRAVETVEDFLPILFTSGPVLKPPTA